MGFIPLNSLSGITTRKHFKKNWYVQEKTNLKKTESLKMNPGTGIL
jgi:hypothetical protein